MLKATLTLTLTLRAAVGMRPPKDVRHVLKHFDNDGKKMAKDGLMQKKKASRNPILSLDPNVNTNPSLTLNPTRKPEPEILFVNPNPSPNAHPPGGPLAPEARADGAGRHAAPQLRRQASAQAETPRAAPQETEPRFGLECVFGLG